MRFLYSGLLFVCVIIAVGLALDPDDLKRARTRKPRSGFRGRGTLSSANAQLNKHLAARTGLNLKACEEFSVLELRSVLRVLFPKASDELKRIYADSDGRSPSYTTIPELEAHWEDSAPAGDHRVRDAHCHEAVMWFTHHVTTEVQEHTKGQITLPMLPAAEHTLKAVRDSTDKAGKFYDSKVTCQACHNGGIENLGVPEVAPATAKAKIRRCYTNYKDLFNVTCGPCDGIAGPYTGDDDKYFTPPNCIVVGTPDEIPESERVPTALPHQFSVDVVGGSDRFGRTTNPDAAGALPGPVAKFYGQISGKWFMDAKPGADLWLLRHDTTYGSASENGVPIPFISPHVTEIHAQTAKMMSENDTGPMVSLIHGLPSWMPGGCTCMPDPVGVPDIAASVMPNKDGHHATKLNDMQYMGRIKLAPIEYLGYTVELDHWANWFFHIFMEVNKSSAFYGKAPRRLGSAYAGTAVYDNWVFDDPKNQDPTVWYREIPTSPERVGPAAGKYCFDTQKVGKYCSNISQATFPMKGEPASVAGVPEHAGHAGASAHADFRHPFFPSGHAITEHTLRAQAEQQTQIQV